MYKRQGQGSARRAHGSGARGAGSAAHGASYTVKPAGSALRALNFAAFARAGGAAGRDRSASADGGYATSPRARRDASPAAPRDSHAARATSKTPPPPGRGAHASAAGKENGHRGAAGGLPVGGPYGFGTPARPVRTLHSPGTLVVSRAELDTPRSSSGDGGADGERAADHALPAKAHTSLTPRSPRPTARAGASASGLRARPARLDDFCEPSPPPALTSASSDTARANRTIGRCTSDPRAGPPLPGAQRQVLSPPACMVTPPEPDWSSRLGAAPAI